MSEPIDPGPPRQTLWHWLKNNPVVVGAAITAYVTLTTALFGYFNARNAQHIEQRRFEFQSSLDERKYETSIILQVMQSAGENQQVVIRRLCLLAKTGLIPTTAAKFETATACKEELPPQP
jgi:hypothetical protein